jgi:hypothetical protein
VELAALVLLVLLVQHHIQLALFLSKVMEAAHLRSTKLHLRLLAIRQVGLVI